jgi:predicted O-methyltransferase YrrM
MQAHEIARVLDGIPNMDLRQGAEITQFIKEKKLSRCLELGFAHGVGTAYIAHAVAELDNGKVVTIDLETARQRNPAIHTVLNMVGVPKSLVEIYFEPTSYTWRMMRFLEQGLRDYFDFIYLDGAHTWAVDGLAFYLGSLLLKPGGWILFDDLKWTLAGSSIAEEPWVKRLPPDERETAQVGKIWNLLVKDDPAFDLLIEKGNWGYARKSTGGTPHRVVVKYHPLVSSLRYVRSLLIGCYRHQR